MVCDREIWAESRVYNILDGVKEAERVVHLDKDPETGFVLVPDLKWDQTSMKALVSSTKLGEAHYQYLTVLVQTKSIRSLRDLSPDHLPLLNKIRDTTRQVVKDKFGVEKDKIRLFVHYQPSYCKLFGPRRHSSELTTDHFHVHVVHIDHEGLAGMTVGQAHLLDDLISLVSYK
jgi:m7GpppX diphosphatase